MIIHLWTRGLSEGQPSGRRKVSPRYLTALFPCRSWREGQARRLREMSRTRGRLILSWCWAVGRSARWGGPTQTEPMLGSAHCATLRLPGHIFRLRQITSQHLIQRSYPTHSLKLVNKRKFNIIITGRPGPGAEGFLLLSLINHQMASIRTRTKIAEQFPLDPSTHVCYGQRVHWPVTLQVNDPPYFQVISA